MPRARGGDEGKRQLLHVFVREYRPVVLNHDRHRVVVDVGRNGNDGFRRFFGGRCGVGEKVVEEELDFKLIPENLDGTVDVEVNGDMIREKLRQAVFGGSRYLSRYFRKIG